MCVLKYYLFLLYTEDIYYFIKQEKNKHSKNINTIHKNIKLYP
jgi:hypothetical protein